MNITYIHHSAFLVETPSAWLLFDYFEGELPAIPAEKPLYVFSSHAHDDHFSRNIFSLARPGVTFLLSADISADTVPEESKGCTHFLPPREIWQDDTLRVETLRSTDEGVAFWCRVDRKEIYHAGDLNHWYWEGEDEDWNREMTAAYRSEMALLAGRRADVAFLPVDPRLEDWFWLGAHDFLKEADAACIFPMHFWGDFSVCEKLKNHPAVKNHRERIVSISRKGQHFSL